MPELPRFLDSAYQHFDKTTPSPSSGSVTKFRPSKRIFLQGFCLGAAISACFTTVVLAILLK